MLRPEAAASAEILRVVEAAVSNCVGRLVVGCSGGLDSTLLLWAVNHIAPNRVVAAHVNHNVHPDAFVWQRGVAAFAAERQIPFHTKTVDLSSTGNFELNARRARHAWLASLLNPGDVLLLAHHQNDQVETALLRLHQGRGAYGIPERRVVGEGELVRPLLTVPRSLIRSAAAEQGLSWVEDSANLDEHLDRVWLRRRVTPEFDTRDPGAISRIATVGRRELDREAAALDLARQLPEPLPLSSLPARVQVAAETVRWWLLARGAESPSTAVLSTWLLRVEGDSYGTRVLDLPVGKLIRYEAELYWARSGGVPSEARITTASGELQLEHGVLRWTSVDPRLGLMVRFDRGELKLQRGAGSTSARALLQSAVLPWERVRYPLICLDDSLRCVPGIASASSVIEESISFVTNRPVLRSQTGHDPSR